MCANAQMECRFSLLSVTLAHHSGLVIISLLALGFCSVSSRILAEMNPSSSSIDLSGDAYAAIL